MKKKALKKFLAGFMVMAVLSGTVAPVSLIFAAEETMADKNLVLEKLKSEQLEKTERLERTGQLKSFNSKGKMETFSMDESLKKIADVKQSQKQNYVEGEVLVKFKEQKINLEQSTGRAKAMQFAVSKNLDKKEDIRKSNISVLKIKDAKTVEEKIAELKNDSRVEYVQPNFLYYPLTIDTNDTYKAELWGLDNDGQTVNTVTGTPNADIDAPEAWAILDGSEDDIIVAVIDDGVAYNHPDLAGNMWNGSACVGSDKNGSPLSGGCLHGYDYEDNDLYPLPTSGSHGTHIAGTIGAVKNNNKGIIGVAPNVKIMALKVNYSTSQIVKSIDFAGQNNAKVINASWGCYGSDQGGIHAVCGGDHDYRDQAMINAIESFPGLFIAVAGNGDGDTDEEGDDHDNGQALHSYPCDHTADNIICVAATDSDDNLADFSDYGVDSVDVGAPGVNIYSTVAGTTYFGTEVLNETFDGIANLNVPSGWVKTDNWGVFDTGIEYWDEVLYGDVSHIPYKPLADSIITLPTYNLANAGGANIDFWTMCDTEYFPIDSQYFWTDYMTLELSEDGINFTEVLKWNEALIDTNYPDSSGYASYHFQSISIPSNYLTNNFKLRFRWKTDSSNVPDIDYGGCLVDDIKITKYTDGSDENYDYSDGTSMATPHVAGLAALIWGYKSELSIEQVKNAIINTGDDLPVASKAKINGGNGKRINAFNALNSLTSSGTEVSGNITEDTTWTLENSPYIVTGTVQVLEDIKLTIESGVEVKFNENTGLNIGGGLNAIGTESEMITFTSNQENQNSGDWIGIEFINDSVDAQADSQNNYLSGSIIKYCVIEYAEDGIRSQYSSQYISNNIIRHNISEGIQLHYSGSLLKDNIISNNFIGIQFTNHDVSEGREFVITGNQIINNSDDGIYGLQDTNATISHNDIYGNKNGIDIVGTYTTPNINFNNIYNNSNYNILMKYNNYEDVNAQNNWWGTVNIAEIEIKIYDYYDDISLGKVIYEPFATAELDFDDQTAPSLSEENPVPTPTNNNTPEYTFNSDEAGTITYGGLCTSATNSVAFIGNNTITFDPLDDGVYDDCTITVTDAVGNASALLDISPFTIDTQIPIITLLGDNPVELFVGDTYIEYGATATDNVGITEDIEIDSSDIDISTAGTYKVTYNVSDSADNPADEVTRTVIVGEIPNSPPAMESIILDPNPAYTNDDIIATAVASDGDGDIVTFSYQWKNNGENVGNDSDTLPSDNFVKGNEILVIITLNDGTENGEPMTSDTLVVSNSIPTQPTVSIEPNPAYADNDLICIPSGSTDTDVNDNPVSYIYQWYKDDVIQVGYFSNTVLASETTVGDVWKCEVVADDGEDQSETGEDAVTILEVPDETPPTAEETTPVATPTNDTTPNIGITVESGASWEIKNGDDVLVTGIGTGAEQIIALPELGEGIYNLSLVATDEAENTAAINLSEFEIDLSVSSISLSTLPNNPTNETTTDITVSGDDIVFYRYNLDSTGYGVEISIDTNIVLSGLSEGEHTIFVKGRDGVGNWSDEISETWTVDLTAPDAPVVIDPAEAVILNADTYSIIGTAEDNSLIKIYSGVELVGSQQLGTGESAYSIEVSLVQNADNNFTATATDLAKNESASAAVPIITEDSIVPVVIITSPTDGLITNQSTIIVEWTINGIHDSNTENLSEGINNIIRNYTDEAGNMGSNSITVILDTTKPVITLTGSDTINFYVGDTYEELGATAEDNVSDAITIDSSDVNTDMAGTYEVTYNVSDVTGNVADEVIRTVIVSEDTTPPVRSNSSPTGVLVVGTTQTTLSLTTDENATCYYSTVAGTEYSAMTDIFDTTGSTDHSTLVTGLTNNNSYTYYIRCQDNSDNSNPDDYEISFSVASPPAPSGGGGGGSYTPPTSVSSSNESLKITSTQQGTLTQNLNNENKVKVEIPKGSIKSTTTFTVSEGSLEEGDIPKDKIGAFLFNGLVFNIEAVDLSNNAVREFSEDLTITLTVPDLPDDTTGLELYYYDDESEEWVIITDIEFGDGTITFKVDHLTQFAVFETNATKASSTSGTPEVKGVTTTEILDGDIIQCKSSDNPFAVYIVKIVGDTKYIRHIVSLEIFNYYGHLKWENLKQVESLNSYLLSGWVRYNTGLNYTATPTDRVYEINGDQTKHWINMTAEQFLSHGGSEPAIFNINQGELNLYTTGADVMSL